MASTDEVTEVPETVAAVASEDAPAENTPAEDKVGDGETSVAQEDSPDSTPAAGSDSKDAEMTEDDIKGIIKIQATYRGHLARKQVAGAGGKPEGDAEAADAAAPGDEPEVPAADADKDSGKEPAAAGDELPEKAAQPEPAAAPAPAESTPTDADEAATAKAATTIQATFRGHQARKELAAGKKTAGAAEEPADAAADAGQAADAAPEVASNASKAADTQREAATDDAKADTEAEAKAAAAARKATEAAAEAAEPIIVVCGPSGVGKGTLIGRLMQEHPQRFGFSVSHTTRAPRPGEEDGVHYHFRSKEEVLEGVRAGLFLEHAEVHGNVYGTSIAAAQAVAQQGKLCVLDIDTQGAEQVKKSPYGAKALFLFVMPPSMDELERRLRGRGTETEDKIATRLKNASAEVAKSKEPGFFTTIIPNNDLDTAYADFKAAIRAHIPNSIPADKPTPASAATATTPAPSKLKSSALDALLTSPSRTWASEDMRGLPVRQYMNEAVVPVLREALRALNKGRPEDPLQFVADYVLAERNKLIQSGQY